MEIAGALIGALLLGMCIVWGSYIIRGRQVMFGPSFGASKQYFTHGGQVARVARVEKNRLVGFIQQTGFLTHPYLPCTWDFQGRPYDKDPQHTLQQGWER